MGPVVHTYSLSPWGLVTFIQWHWSLRSDSVDHNAGTTQEGLHAGPTGVHGLIELGAAGARLKWGHKNQQDSGQAGVYMYRGQPLVQGQL